MYLIHHQVLFGVWASLAAADYLTGFYPPPIDLTSNDSLVAKSWKELNSVFDTYLHNEKHTGPQSLVKSDAGNLTFSLGMFSLRDPSAINLQYHYTAPEVATAKGGTNKVSGLSLCHSSCVQLSCCTACLVLCAEEVSLLPVPNLTGFQVDADSIYIMASVSKLVTTYMSMLHLSPDDWNRPLIDIHPAFKKYFTGTSDAIWNTQWDQVTLWSLATQMSGLPTVSLHLHSPCNSCLGYGTDRS